MQEREGRFGRAAAVWPRARFVTKPLLMPVIAAVSTSGPVRRQAPLVLAAQALSWSGDIALMGRSRRTFLAGLGSFLGAQLAYNRAYRTRSTAGVLATPGRRGFCLAGSAAAVGMGALAGRRDRALAAPVAAYGLALVGMVASAAAIDRPEERRRVVVGSSLFLVSDVLIGVRMFVAGNDSLALEAAVMTTYATGQWWIGRGIEQAVPTTAA